MSQSAAAEVCSSFKNIFPFLPGGGRFYHFFVCFLLKFSKDFTVFCSCQVAGDQEEEKEDGARQARGGQAVAREEAR